MAQATEARPNVRRSPLDLYGMQEQLRGGTIEREDSLSVCVGIKNALLLLAGLGVVGWVVWQCVAWVCA